VLLLPDQKVGVPHLLVTAGKEGTVFLIDRDRMGNFSRNDDNVVQLLPAGTIGGSVGDGLQGTPALYQNRIYFAGSRDFLKAFEFSEGLLSTTPVSRSLNRFNNKGATASVSANGDKDAIVWAIEYASRNAVLHAYDAMNLDVELYSSGPDGVVGGSKFSLPTVANGKVYIGIGQSSPTDFGGLVVFGLLSANGKAQR
jgi:hypothetical protein